MLAPCPLVLAGVNLFSARSPIFPTCMKKCAALGARVSKGQSRAWGRVGTNLPPNHPMAHCRGLSLTSLVEARLRFILVVACWMKLI